MRAVPSTTNTLSPLAQQRAKMQRPIFCRAVPSFFLALLIALSTSAALALDIPAEHHPWGHFRAGSWVRHQRTEFTTGADGKEQADRVTTTTTRLEEVRPDGVSLHIEIAVEGQPATTESRRYGWDGLEADIERTIRLSVGEIKIAGKSFVCQTHEASVEQPGRKSTNKWWYCPDQAPYLLKQIVRTTGGGPFSRSYEFTALGTERDVLGRKLICDETQIIESNTDRASRTIQQTSFSVPGGVISEESQIRDKRRGQVGRTRLELEAYEIAE